MQPAVVVPMPIDDDEEEAVRVVEHDGTATAPSTMTLEDVTKPAANDGTNKRTKKERREFTAEEKYAYYPSSMVPIPRQSKPCCASTA